MAAATRVLHGRARLAALPGALAVLVAARLLRLQALAIPAVVALTVAWRTSARRPSRTAR